MPKSVHRALVILTVLARPVAADTTQQDLAKYLRLRDRLVGEFVTVGTGQGQSEPAVERTDSVALLKWADATIALGWYIGVLATEHYMLANPAVFPGADGGDSTRLDTTRTELYDALLAAERLDNVANAAFPAPCTTTPALDGFFIRDDVPASFSTSFPGITTIQSDFIDPTLTNKEESQDQVYHLQHGLALVVALVPPDVVVNGKALRAWAIEQAQRIIEHFASGLWVITNPACGNRAVARGSDAIGYSYGETLAATYVTDGALVPTTDSTWSTIWDTLEQPTNPAYSDVDNLHMALAIMAVGDGYGSDTPQVIATLAQTQDWPLYPLLHRVLHPTSAGFCATAPMVNTRARAMLDELPADGEPECPGSSGPAPHGFTTSNRFIRPASQAYVGPPGCVGVRYDGLDYMLLHNLYAIATPGTWNGSPDANPCAAAGDGATAAGDAGFGASAGDAGAGSTARTGGGCGCHATSGGGAAWLASVVVAAAGLRRRRVSSSRADRRAGLARRVR
ncbi:MAG TPA: MYXO-CTERM sorting domain-containing protein [Kofleriaceae bacterium]|nr:MYXO-CTERM sorting domain-containing protein [Kofleriaceae bacterium]